MENSSGVSFNNLNMVSGDNDVIVDSSDEELAAEMVALRKKWEEQARQLEEEQRRFTEAVRKRREEKERKRHEEEERRRAEEEAKRKAEEEAARKAVRDAVRKVVQEKAAKAAADRAAARKAAEQISPDVEAEENEGQAGAAFHERRRVSQSISVETTCIRRQQEQEGGTVMGKVYPQGGNVKGKSKSRNDEGEEMEWDEGEKRCRTCVHLNDTCVWNEKISCIPCQRRKRKCEVVVVGVGPVVGAQKRKRERTLTSPRSGKSKKRTRQQSPSVGPSRLQWREGSPTPLQGWRTAYGEREEIVEVDDQTWVAAADNIVNAVYDAQTDIQKMSNVLEQRLWCLWREQKRQHAEHMAMIRAIIVALNGQVPTEEELHGVVAGVPMRWEDMGKLDDGVMENVEGGSKEKRAEKQASKGV